MVVFRLSLRLLVASALFVMGADNAHAYLTPGDSFGVPSADQAVDDIPVIPSIDTLEPQVQDPAHDPPFPVGTGGGGGPTRGSQDPNLVKTLNSTNRAGAENSAPSEKNQETNGGTHNASPENTQTMPPVL